MHFCNNTTQIMDALSHHMKQDTSIESISHCIKLVKDACLGFLHKQFKNTTNKQPPWKNLLPHMTMATPLVKKFLAFSKPEG